LRSPPYRIAFDTASSAITATAASATSEAGFCKRPSRGASVRTTSTPRITSNTVAKKM
jgi:hypothetical protein